MRSQLFFILVSLFISTFAYAEADQRLLTLEFADKQIELTVSDLNAIGSKQIEIERDIVYSKPAIYNAIALKDILESINMPLEGKLLLVCSDGYTLPLDLDVLNDPDMQAYLALSSAEATKQGNWQPYQHGHEWISFDPFYLVWNSKDQSALTKLPWPYQLASMKLEKEDLYADLALSKTTDERIQNGKGLFIEYCVKCHKINKTGGDVGPSLTTSAFVRLSEKSLISEFIWDIKRFYSASAMPVFNKTLSKQQVADLVAYLSLVTENK